MRLRRIEVNIAKLPEPLGTNLIGEPCCIKVEGDYRR